MLKIAGDAIVGGYFTNHYSPDDPRPEVQTWVKKYETKYGSKPDALATLAYDATTLMLEAIKSAKTANPPDVRNALQNFKGLNAVSGSISYDASGNPIKDAVILKYTKNGQEFVTSVKPE
jgi:branched-chain amino acid transport system substrate-binding protein